MTLSSRLTSLYGEKDRYLSGLSLLNKEMGEPISLEDGIKSPDVALEFSASLMKGFVNNFNDFEKSVADYEAAQGAIVELSRYSSYLQQVVPFKLQSLPEDLSLKRDVLNALRRHFTESMVNGDLGFLRTSMLINALFSEVDNFIDFMRVFAEYHSYRSVVANPVSLELETKYKEALGAVVPGAILATALQTEVIDLNKGIVDTVNEIIKKVETDNIVDTETNTLVWPMERSYLDTPIRFYQRTGTTPLKRFTALSSQLSSMHLSLISDDLIPGVEVINKWMLYIHNTMLLLMKVNYTFVELLQSTFLVSWDFLFYQLSQLEDLEEEEIVNSVLELFGSEIIKE